MSEIEFVSGLRVFAPREGAPDYILANLVIEREELAAWLRTHPEKVRIDIKRSKTGKLYAAVNNWKPQSDAAATGNQTLSKPTAKASPASAQDDFADDVPF